MDIVFLDFQKLYCLESRQLQQHEYGSIKSIKSIEKALSSIKRERSHGKTLMMVEQINEVVLPGDVIWKLDNDAKEKDGFKLGPGLRQECGNIIAFKAGILKKKEPNIFWVDNNQRRVINFINFFMLFNFLKILTIIYIYFL